MTEPTPEIAELRLKRLRFRAWRRGFREADLILGRFADERGAGLSEGDLAAFEALLDQPDQDVYAWILRAEPTPSAFETSLLDQIRAFCHANPMTQL